MLLMLVYLLIYVLVHIVCAEWDYGGLPAWLNQIPNISFRSNNDAWKREMLKFVMSIINYIEP